MSEAKEQEVLTLAAVLKAIADVRDRYQREVNRFVRQGDRDKALEALMGMEACDRLAQNFKFLGGMGWQALPESSPRLSLTRQRNAKS